MYRDNTKIIKIGDKLIGGGNPIMIQSMTNTHTEDVEATVKQILRLEKAGCDIIRCTVPTIEAAHAIKEIKKQIHIPLVADIHFDYKMAIAAMENGADKIRINPGNIGSTDKIKAVVDVAKSRKRLDILNNNISTIDEEIKKNAQNFIDIVEEFIKKRYDEYENSAKDTNVRGKKCKRKFRVMTFGEFCYKHRFCKQCPMYDNITYSCIAPYFESNDPFRTKNGKYILIEVKE